MKKTILINCLICSYLLVTAGNPPEGNVEVSNVFMSTATYQFNVPGVKYIYPEWGFYIEESTGFSNIRNKNLSSDILDSKGGLGFTLNAGYFYSLNPRFRFKAGLGFSYLSGKMEGNGDVISQQLPDIDNDMYTETLTLNNVKNNVNLIYLSIPFILEYGNVNITRNGYYIDAGLKYSFLLTDKFKSDGSYSTKGYYEKWGVTLENIDELGYYSDRPLESSSKFKKSDISVIGGFGISVPVSPGSIMKFGITGSFGLMDIGNNGPSKSENPSISVETHNFRAAYTDNALATVKGTRTWYIGLDFELYINKRIK